jgi:lysophospholipase L1-like esterase
VVGSSPFDWALDIQRLRASVNVPTSYPAVLQTLLTSRYTAQTPVVFNEGLGGEGVTGASTLPRLTSVLGADTPQVLLLQEGINDVNFLVPTSQVIASLRELIRTARSRGIRVFLGTLLPERAGSCRARQPAAIPGVNDQIRALAASEGATLVDLYAAFLGRLDVLLGEDGLHPNVAGYEAMAQTFFNSIRDTLEAAATASPSPAINQHE